MNNQDRNNIWLYGKHTAQSVVQNKQRQIHKILCTPQSHDEIAKFIQNNNRHELLKATKVVDKHEIAKYFGDVSHQSIAIYCSKKKTHPIDDLLYNIENGQENGNLLVFDQLTDPQNIGAIIRSACAFGIKNVAAPINSFPGETAAMVKASSGNFEKINIYTTNNISNLLLKIKKLDYWCIGLAGQGAQGIDKINNFEKIALVIGSEGSGIRPLVKKSCDLLVKIPMEDHVESLNASNAASIALYELYKNR